tara:strand:- start:539 stop:1036 length:498 start_codon:yes stop_codon:yes gene_type:complete
MIEYFDNVFSTAIVEEINTLLRRPKWSFNGGGLAYDGDFVSNFWHMDHLEEEDYFLNLFENIKEKLFKDQTVKIVRCYANGQTAGQSGVPHRDDGDVTVLYFPTRWKHHLGGHLNFVSNNNIKSLVEYKQNRLVKFNSEIVHYSSAPVYNYIGLRISLAYKVKII